MSNEPQPPPPGTLAAGALMATIILAACLVIASMLFPGPDPLGPFDFTSAVFGR